MKSRFYLPLHANHLLVAAWVVILAYLLLAAVGAFIYDCSENIGDSCVYIYVAKGILEGDIPYVDRWDNKGPLLYLLNFIGLVIHESWGLWVVQGAFLLGASSFAFLTLRRGFGTTPALFSLALFLVSYSRLAPQGNDTELYLLLVQFLALYLFLHSQEQPNPATSRAGFTFLHLAIGALGAASFLLKPSHIALWIVIGLYWLLLRGDSLRKLGWAFVGGGSVLVLVAGLFTALGAWNALWNAVFEFSFAQSGASIQDRLEVIRHLTAMMFPISMLVIAAWCIGIISLVRRQVPLGGVKDLLIIALALLPIEVISISLSGIKNNRYFLTALPVFALLLAFLVYLAFRRRLIAPSLLGFALLFGVTYYASPHTNFTPLVRNIERAGQFLSGAESPQAARLREIIQGSTESHDPILVWGWGPWVYLISDRDAPTRFFYDFPLTKPNYTDQSIRHEFVSDVMTSMPKFIIDMRKSRLPPLATSERINWRPAYRYEHEPEDFTPFLDFVAANYLAVDTTPLYTIYAVRSDDGKGSAAIQGNVIIRSTYVVYLSDRILTYVKNPCTQDDATNRFILQVFPVDKSVINGNELHNMDFSFIEGKDWHVGEACVVSRDLPNYPIAFIRTGQYNASESAHDWLNEYHFPELQ